MQEMISSDEAWLELRIPGKRMGEQNFAQLCLEAIEHICAECTPATMLDMGAGSDILAIAAAKLGVKHVLALDNDPDAMDACRKNAGINNASIESRLGDSPPNRKFDLVVANILARPFMDMAPKLAKCVGKRLVLSGLLREQVEDVGHAYGEAGLTIVRTDMQGEWAAVELRL